jgi:hypothetical protein
MNKKTENLNITNVRYIISRSSTYYTFIKMNASIDGNKNDRHEKKNDRKTGKKIRGNKHRNKTDESSDRKTGKANENNSNEITKNLTNEPVENVVENSIKNGVQDCGDWYLFSCPHCGISIKVLKKDLKCKIFRCGQYISSGKPIRPHMSEKQCKQLKEQNKIYGCGKPFRFKGDHIEVCGYV